MGCVAAGRGGIEVVLPFALVVDPADHALRPAAEGLVRRRIRVAARRQHAHVGRGVRVAAAQLVEGSGIGAEEGADGAVGGDAGGATGAVDVARPGGGGRRAEHGAGGQQQQRHPWHCSGGVCIFSQAQVFVFYTVPTW